MRNYTACYKKISSGYMGQLLEWPQVVTEGVTITECREMLADAAKEMALAYQEEGIPVPGALSGTGSGEGIHKRAEHKAADERTTSPSTASDKLYQLQCF